MITHRQATTKAKAEWTHEHHDDDDRTNQTIPTQPNVIGKVEDKKVQQTGSKQKIHDETNVEGERTKKEYKCQNCV